LKFSEKFLPTLLETVVDLGHDDVANRRSGAADGPQAIAINFEVLGNQPAPVKALGRRRGIRRRRGFHDCRGGRSDRRKNSRRRTRRRTALNQQNDSDHQRDIQRDRNSDDHA
jgi:hypothetical protein